MDLHSEIQIRSIELLQSSLKIAPAEDRAVTAFNFTIGIESKADANEKLMFVIVHVEIKNDDQSLVLGAISVSCIYEIPRLDELIKTDAKGKACIPEELIETLNTISVSTTRGVMFSTFKGTFLHGAVLPLIDPRQLK